MRRSPRAHLTLGLIPLLHALVFSLVTALAVAPAFAVRLTQLTQTARDENWGTFGPDGNLLFSSGKSICGNGAWFCGPQDIWSASVFNGELLSLNLLSEDAYHPRYSPDGKYVACMRYNGEDWDIYVWPTALGFEYGNTFQSTPGYHERFPNWSNDSAYIAFDSDRPDSGELRAYQVYYAPVAAPGDPSQAVRVTFLGSNNKHPTWNADDTELAYVGDADENRTLSAVNLVNGAYRKITQHASQNRHPDWSPDGKWIAFTTDRWDGIGDIAIIRADGKGGPVLVTEGMPSHDDFPEWSHDSQSLLFCGTAINLPHKPNKEIFLAEDLPFEAATVSVREESAGSLKAQYKPKP